MCPFFYFSQLHVTYIRYISKGNCYDGVCRISGGGNDRELGDPV